MKYILYNRIAGMAGTKRKEAAPIGDSLFYVQFNRLIAFNLLCLILIKGGGKVQGLAINNFKHIHAIC